MVTVYVGRFPTVVVVGLGASSVWMPASVNEDAANAASVAFVVAAGCLWLLGLADAGWRRTDKTEADRLRRWLVSIALFPIVSAALYFFSRTPTAL